MNENGELRNWDDVPERDFAKLRGGFFSVRYRGDGQVAGTPLWRVVVGKTNRDAEGGVGGRACGLEASR